MIEVTEEVVKEQAKVVFNLGLELQNAERQVISGFQKQMQAAQDIALLRIKYLEEAAVLGKMQDLLAEHNAKSRTLDLVIP